MNVLIVLNGGITKRENGLFILNGDGAFLLELAALGHKIEVFHFYFLYEGKNSSAGFDLLNRSNIKVTSLEHKNKILSYIIAYSKLVNCILKNDFTYFFFPSSFCYAGFLSKWLGKKFGLYVRGEEGIKSKIAKSLYNYSEFSFTVSPRFTDMIRSYGCNAETIRPMIGYTEDEIDFKRVYKKKEIYNLLFVSRVEEEKGIFELIEAIRRLINDGMKNFNLNIVGEGDAWEKVQQVCLKNGLQKIVKLHGKIVDEVALSYFYKEADIFIHPSYNEGFPRVLYEAMIFGVPIITTFVGAIDGVMIAGYNCYKIAPKDIESIYRCLKEILSNYPEKSVVAKNASSTIIDYLKKYSTSHATLLDNKMKIKRFF